MKKRLSKAMRIFFEIKYLIAEHKLYFLTPLLITFVLLSFLFYKIGPSVIISFIYAGV